MLPVIPSCWFDHCGWSLAVGCQLSVGRSVVVNVHPMLLLARRHLLRVALSSWVTVHRVHLCSLDLLVQHSWTPLLPRLRLLVEARLRW